MITIEVNDVEYFLPESWDDVTIKQFQAISNITQEDEYLYKLELLSALTELPTSIIEKIDSKHFQTINNAISFFQTDTLSSDPVKEFTINNNTYKMKELNQLTFGEVYNIKALMKDVKNNLAGIIAILYKKNDEEFDSSKHEEIVKEIETMSVNKLYGVYVFFYLIMKELQERIQTYSEQQQIKEKMKEASWIQRLKIWMSSKITGIRIIWRINYARGKSGVWKKFSK